MLELLFVVPCLKLWKKRMVLREKTRPNMVRDNIAEVKTEIKNRYLVFCNNDYINNKLTSRINKATVTTAKSKQIT